MWVPAVGLSLAFLVSLFAPSSALHRPGALTSMPEGGGVAYVGLVGMVRRPVTVIGIWPKADVPAEVLLCEPAPGADPFYAIPEESLRDHCAALEPVGFGTTLEPNRPEGDADEYLVVKIDMADGRTATFCGLRVLFRAGARVVYAGDAGAANAVWNPPSDISESGYEPCSG